ncbi:MAG TPA: hypothetical protein VKG01_09915 [Thermoanaerobaculia bacterium]|nr:hypothetical protein [Thermoanaerobaculia bacterium]
MLFGGFLSLGAAVVFAQEVETSAAPQALTAEPLVIRDIEAPTNFFDVAYGNYGGWVASDGIGDQLLDLTFGGSVIRTAPLNLLVVNLYPADGKYFFNAVDSNGRFHVGYEAKFTVRGAFLPNGFLSQGSSLAVRPDDNGATTSSALSQGNLFKADQIYTLTPVTLKPQLRGMDVGPGGNFYLGYSSGIQVVTPQGTSSDLGGYSATVNAVKGCGDGIWVGTANSIDWVTVSNGVGSFMRYTTSTPILSIDCGGNGSAVATGALGTLYYVNPALNTFQSFQVQGATNLVKVALGPGVSPRGLVLDFSGGLGTLKSFTLPATYGVTRDTFPTRLISPSIRSLF